MRIKLVFFVVLALLSALLFTACSSSPEERIAELEAIEESSRSEFDWENLAEAYWEAGQFENARITLTLAKQHNKDTEVIRDLLKEYILPAPSLGNQPGNYESPVHIDFKSDQYTHGKLYVAINRSESTEELSALTVSEDGLYILSYGENMSSDIYLFEPGEHTVRAWVVYDDATIHSDVFEGKYTLPNVDFSSVTLSHNPGEHTYPFTLSLNNSVGKAYYTLDGSDPLSIEDGKIDLNGVEITSGNIPLSIGSNSVKIRVQDDSGIVSPLLGGEYKVTMNFDSTDRYVGESDRFEYVTGWKRNSLYYYDKKSGGDLKTLMNADVDSFSVYSSSGKQQVSDQYSSLVNGELSSILGKTTDNTLIYAKLDSGKVYLAKYSDGAKISEEYFGSTLPQFVGSCWLKFGGETYQLPVENVYGTKETAVKATLMTKKIAVYEKYDHTKGGFCIIASNPDGSNERILWANEKHMDLRAVTDKLVLYRLNDKEMVFDMTTGQHRDVKEIPDGATVLGYTSNAVFVEVDGKILRIALDYSKL